MKTEKSNFLMIIQGSNDKVLLQYGNKGTTKFEGKDVRLYFDNFMSLNKGKYPDNRDKLICELRTWMRSAGFKVTCRVCAQSSIRRKIIAWLINHEDILKIRFHKAIKN